MKKLILSILVAALAAVPAFGAAWFPYNPRSKQVQDDLVIGPGRTITIAAGGSLIYLSGANVPAGGGGGGVWGTINGSLANQVDLVGALQGKQPLRNVLTALGNLSFSANQYAYATGPDSFALATATPFGRAILAAPDIEALRILLGLGSGDMSKSTYDTDANNKIDFNKVDGLGDAAAKNTGTTAGTVAAGDDARFSDQRTPSDGSVTAIKIASSLKPSGTALATDEALRALGAGANNAAAGNDSRFSDARTPTAHVHPATEITTGVFSPDRIAAAHSALQVARMNAANTALEFATISVGGGDVLAANNLSELTDKAAARVNIGLSIGSDVQAHNSNLDDLADGSLSGSKVGTGINGDNITSGTVADARIASTIARDSEVTAAADAKVADAINDGTTTVAPSENAVFDALALKANVSLSTSAQVDNYTLVLADAGKIVTVNAATAKTVTVPTYAAVAIPIGTVIPIKRLGAGTVTIAAAGGVTLTQMSTTLVIGAAAHAASLFKTANDTWEVRVDMLDGSAAADPTVNDDAADGLQIGSIWRNSSTGHIWYCYDNTTAAAGWSDLSATGTGLADPGANGVVARTGAGTTANRTITGTANEVTVTNGDGVAGNPTVSLPATMDLTGKAVTVATATAGDNDTSAASTAFVATAVSNHDAASRTSTNETFDTSGTGNVFKFYTEEQFAFPDQVDNTGATRVTAEGATYGHATFSNSAAASGNYVIYRWRVPADLDTGTDLAAAFTFRLGGADTGKHRYILSMADVTSSAGADAPTFSNAINLDFAGDASGASADIEQIAAATLTTWRSSLTAGHLIVVKLARDGSDATNDTSTVNSTDVNLTIRVYHSQ